MERNPRAEKTRDWRHNDRAGRAWDARPPVRRVDLASTRDA